MFPGASPMKARSPSLPTFQTARLVVRPFVREDARALYELCVDPEIMARHLRAPMQGVAEAARAVADFQRAAERSLEWVWAIALADRSDRPVGFCGLQRIYLKGPAAISAALHGVHLEPTHWGKGFIVEALEPVVSYAFDVLGFHRLQGWNTVDHVASSRIKEKIGCRREGVYKEAVYFNGKFHDMVRYALLKNEWAERKRPTTSEKERIKCPG